MGDGDSVFPPEGRCELAHGQHEVSVVPSGPRLQAHPVIKVS